MIRTLVLLLMASPAWAGGAYDTLVASYGASHHWPFSSAATDVIGGTSTTCTGTCSYGTSLATNITAASFGSTLGSSSYLYASAYLTVPPDWGYSRYNWSTVIWIKTASTNQERWLWQAWDYSWTMPLQTNLLSSDSVSYCSTGQASTAYLRSDSSGGISNVACSTTTVNDGSTHMVSISCPQSLSACLLYVDGVYQSTTPGTLDYLYDTGPSTDNYFWDNGHAGVVGDVSYYPDIALTAAQMLCLYKTGIGVSCSGGGGTRAPIGQIIGLRDTAPRLPAALRGAYRRIEPASVSSAQFGGAQAGYPTPINLQKWTHE